MRKFIIMAVAVVALAFAGQAMASDGAGIFASKCAMCHGQGGAGSTMAPALKGNAFIKGDAGAIATTIKEGRSGGAKKYSNFPISMPGFGSQLSGGDVDGVIKYLKSL
jgi:cytochrome c6